MYTLISVCPHNLAYIYYYYVSYELQGALSGMSSQYLLYLKSLSVL